MCLAYKTPEVDTHTHTVISGHAWSTLSENVSASKQKGLKAICLTEHGPDMPGGAPEYVTLSQTMLPSMIDGIRIYKGIEANIKDFKGTVDIRQRYLSYCDFVIASIHEPVLSGGTEEQYTEAYISALHNPYVDIIGHPDNPKIPCNIESVIKEAEIQKKLLEFNNNSFSSIRPNSLPSLVKYIKLCKKHQARICVASDAHFHTMIGSVSQMMKLLDEISYPPQLIVNLTMESFELYLVERKHGSRDVQL